MAAQQKRNTSPNRPSRTPGPYMDPPIPLVDTPEETAPLVAGRRDPDNNRGQSKNRQGGGDQNREGGGASGGRPLRRTQDSETGSTDAEPDGSRDNPGRSSGDQR